MDGPPSRLISSASFWIEFMRLLNTMFTPKSNTTFNNILFNAETIPNMHASMERLYQFVDESCQLSGQSALARRMDESPQTVKNWETRGISEGGALKAQHLFGCNANWLLGTSKETKAPSVPSAAIVASDNNAGWQWPFWSVSPKAYGLLSPEEKEHIENGILITVKNRGQPSKQHAPENKIAAG